VTRPGRLHVPVVGIGASAGGLEALDELLAAVPKRSGLAYVVIQHLDPTHVGMLPELLGRITRLPVVEAVAGMVAEPDHVYVIPPNRDIAILRGVLQVIEPAEPRGLRLPIDRFFRSLADDQGARATGVVLSGMGTDGTQGLRAIHDHGGLTIAQTPTTAQFDAMPRSAIASGAVDVVAAPSAMPLRILGLQGKTSKRIPRPAVAAEPGGPLDRILLQVRQRTGADFSLYKESTILRRIERRIVVHDAASLEDYARFLVADPGEVDLLFRELLIGVTSFFREPAAWERLAEDVLPALLESRRASRSLRAWIPGCSTGEEAYTLAIVLTEAIERLEPRWSGSLQLFATDLDGDAIDRARRAEYPAGIAADVSPERLDRFFVPHDDGYRVGKEIRSAVVFAPHNVSSDPPFTRMDIVSCRNLLIYFGPDLQRTVIPVFHYAIRPGGILILGNAETIGGHRDLFEPIGGRERIFRRLDGGPVPGGADWPLPFSVTPRVAGGPVEPEPVAGSLRASADRLLLERHAPAAVLATAAGDIVYINGRTGDYLEPAAGKANWNLHVMAREGLRTPLMGAFRRAITGRVRVELTGVEVASGGGPITLNVTVEPVFDPGPLDDTVLVVFTPVSGPAGRRRPRVRATGPATPATSPETSLAAELRSAREELEVTRGEMQASLEELKSTNEELQSTNEELQSTNEELTTSKEELQSMNEELQVVNAELGTHLDELMLSNSDMQNLINTTEIATVFLDSRLRIRRFTASATRLISLIPSDVGRPLSDVTNEMDYPTLITDAESVLRTLASIDREVTTRRGAWYAARVVPYRTLDNVIDGVVVTFSDISRVKQLELALARTRPEATASPETPS